MSCSLHLRLQGRRRLATRWVRPGDDLEPSIEMLDNGGATLDPITAIDVADAVFVMDRRVMDVTADDAVRLMALRLHGERAFEVTDEVYCIFYLEFRPLRQRPVSESEPSPAGIEQGVEQNGGLVGLVTDQCEPARMLMTTSNRSPWMTR